MEMYEYKNNIFENFCSLKCDGFYRSFGGKYCDHHQSKKDSHLTLKL